MPLWPVGRSLKHKTSLWSSILQHTGHLARLKCRQKPWRTSHLFLTGCNGFCSSKSHAIILFQYLVVPGCPLGRNLSSLGISHNSTLRTKPSLTCCKIIDQDLTLQTGQTWKPYEYLNALTKVPLPTYRQFALSPLCLTLDSANKLSR